MWVCKHLHVEARGKPQIYFFKPCKCSSALFFLCLGDFVCLSLCLIRDLSWAWYSQSRLVVYPAALNIPFLCFLSSRITYDCHNSTMLSLFTCWLEWWNSNYCACFTSMWLTGPHLQFISQETAVICLLVY